MRGVERGLVVDGTHDVDMHVRPWLSLPVREGVTPDEHPGRRCHPLDLNSQPVEGTVGNPHVELVRDTEPGDRLGERLPKQPQFASFPRTGRHEGGQVPARLLQRREGILAGPGLS